MAGLRQAPRPISPANYTTRSSRSITYSDTGSAATSSSVAGGRLNGLLRQKESLEEENQELQELVNAARTLLQEAALVRNAADAPAVVKTKAEEEILAKGEELRRKAVLCASRPVSATSCRSHALSTSSRLRVRARPTSAGSSRGHQTPKRQLSARAVGPPAEGGEAKHLPSTFKVDLERGADDVSLGMKVKAVPGSVLEVTTVKEDGLVASWNQAHQQKAIREGQLIVEVNGVSGDTDLLFEELKSPKLCLILVDRVGSPASPAKC